MSYCSICHLPRRNKRSDMCSQCEKGGTVERKFIEEVRALSGDVEDPVQEDVIVEVKTSGTQVERVLAPDSDNESNSLLEQVMTLQGNEEKLRDAHRFIDMLKEENARHLTKISSLMSKVDRKESAKKQLLARLKEEIENREMEERRRKNMEAVGRHYEASAQGYANECKQLREQLEKAENEIKKLSGEVNLDIPSMLKEIEELKQTIQKRDRAITHREKAYKEIASRNGALVVELGQVKQQLKDCENDHHTDEFVAHLRQHIEHLETLKDSAWKEWDNINRQLHTIVNERSTHIEELEQKLKDCEKQRDEAEKGYGEREALAGEIHRLRREREDMILWGRETWKKVEEQGLEIAKVRQELKTHQNTLGELEVAEVQYLTTIRDLEARLKFTEERMENFKDLWVQATENNNRTPATSPITTPDAPLRRSSSVPLPSRCLFPDKRSREDEEEDNDKSPRSKKQLKF